MYCTQWWYDWIRRWELTVRSRWNIYPMKQIHIIKSQYHFRVCTASEQLGGIKLNNNKKQEWGIVAVFLSRTLVHCRACSSGKSLHPHSTCRSLAFCVQWCEPTKCLTFPYRSYNPQVVMEIHCVAVAATLQWREEQAKEGGQLAQPLLWASAGCAQSVEGESSDQRRLLTSGRKQDGSLKKLGRTRALCLTQTPPEGLQLFNMVKTHGLNVCGLTDCVEPSSKILNILSWMLGPMGSVVLTWRQ